MRFLINSISWFILLMSCRTSKRVPSQKEFESMGTILKHLKPILDEISDSKIPSDENLEMVCERLDISVTVARELVKRLSPELSRIPTVS